MVSKNVGELVINLRKLTKSHAFCIMHFIKIIYGGGVRYVGQRQFRKPAIISMMMTNNQIFLSTNFYFYYFSLSFLDICMVLLYFSHFAFDYIAS